MNAVRPLRETADTVTLRRNDFAALIAASLDAAGIAAAEAHRNHEAALGWPTARAASAPVTLPKWNPAPNPAASPPGTPLPAPGT
jgi:hypothetical protein